MCSVTNGHMSATNKLDSELLIKSTENDRSQEVNNQSLTPHFSQISHY